MVTNAKPVLKLYLQYIQETKRSFVYSSYKNTDSKVLCMILCVVLTLLKTCQRHGKNPSRGN